MKQQKYTLLTLITTMLLATGTASAGQKKPTPPPPAAPAAPGKLMPPIRNVANIGYTKPYRRDEKKTIVTTFEIKNISPSPIAKLKVKKFWFNKTNNPLPNDTFQYKKPLQPNEIITVELRTPRDP